MPKLIFSLDKKVYDPWIVASPGNQNVNQYFTQQEIDNVLTPYIAFIESLPGRVAGKEYAEYVSDTNYTVVREYDTLDNAKNAMLKLSDAGGVPIVIAKNALVRSKMAENAIIYTITNKIIT